MSAEKPNAPAAPAKKKGRGKLPWIVLLALLGAGAGGWWWWQATPAAESTANQREQAQYFALEPAFVVNLADANAVRYLQADVQILTRDAATAAALELHAPAIRNRLLLLFGQQSSSQLAQRSGKERLQEQALAEVRKVLKKEGAPDRVEAVLFTSLVTQ